MSSCYVLVLPEPPRATEALVFAPPNLPTNEVLECSASHSSLEALGFVPARGSFCVGAFQSTAAGPLRQGWDNPERSVTNASISLL